METDIHLDLLKVPEAAQMMRCSPLTIRRLIKTGQLPRVRIRRLLFVRKSAILEWLDRAEHRERMSTPGTHHTTNR